MSDDDDLAPTFKAKDLQWAALAVSDAWMEHDELALAATTAEERAEQRDARWALLTFVDKYRTAAKELEEHDVYHSPDWQVVAGMKDLLAQMFATAEDACDADEQD